MPHDSSAPEGHHERRPCPCWSGERADSCCLPLIAAESEAPTAVQLMRSRYTAFAIGAPQYLLKTWHSSTRPPHLDLDPEVTWVHLEIIRAERGGPFDDDGVVEFAARYRSPQERGVQHEVSRFARVDRTWRYLDGSA